MSVDGHDSGTEGSAADEALTRSAVRGAGVSISGQVVRLLLQMASVVVLARLLTPDDYGLIAMVLSVVGIAGLFTDLGLSTAAVQARTLSQAQRDNLFWINTAVGGAMMLVVAACSGAVAGFFDRHQLVVLTLVLSTTFLISGASVQHRVDLSRRLRFGMMSLIDVIGAVTALAVGIGAALAGAGYWALALQQITAGLVTLVLLVVSAGWLPGRPRRGAGTRRLVRLGLSFFGSSVVHYAARNADAVIIGHRFGAVPLGLYNRSQQIVRTPLSQIQAPLYTVAIPVLSRVDDDARFVRAIKRSQVAMGYPVLLCVATLAAIPQDITLLLLGDEWRGAANLVAIIAVASGLGAVESVGGWFYVARGHADSLLLGTVGTTALTIVLMVWGARYGVEGVAAGLALSTALSWPVTLWIAGRAAGISTLVLHLSALRLLTVATVCWGVTWVAMSQLATPWPAVNCLLAGIFIVFTGLAMSIWPAVRDDWRDIWRLVASFRGS